MELQEFMDEWDCDRDAMCELLGLKRVQIDRHFFAAGTKNRQELKQSHKDRLDEIDLLLRIRSVSAVFSGSQAMRRLDRIIPPNQEKALNLSQSDAMIRLNSIIPPSK